MSDAIPTTDLSPRPGLAATTTQQTGISQPRNQAPTNPAGPTEIDTTDESAQVELSEKGLAAAKNDPAAESTLSPEDQKTVEAMKARDREVRAHERAHQANAGAFTTGSAAYTYERGPDGVSYAVGGEVRITLREGRTPDETIANAQTVRTAALAPATPSPQDRAVAAAASQLEAEATTELTRNETATQPDKTHSRSADQAEEAITTSPVNIAAVYDNTPPRTNGFSAYA